LKTLFYLALKFEGILPLVVHGGRLIITAEVKRKLCVKKLLFVLALAGCVEAAPTQSPPRSDDADRAEVNQAVTRFKNVIQRVKPVAEAECRKRTRNTNCRLNISVAADTDLPPNATMGKDKHGRSQMVFTKSMLFYVHNEDELALIMSHEAAHHILGHFDQSVANATTYAALFETLGAAELGAKIGFRLNSKEMEIAADKLGTIIMKKAGFDPLNGLKYLTRVRDPGDKFLGSHPPNRERIHAIRSVAMQ
jgi:Zn-dependent protease with chaperone function